MARNARNHLAYNGGNGCWNDAAGRGLSWCAKPWPRFSLRADGPSSKQDSGSYFPHASKETAWDWLLQPGPGDIGGRRRGIPSPYAQQENH
ncbi:hypothetical protein NDU88_006555 [Pleurodeles waltl]|uniref:Uncharacterized protein n=1 Tax=Pleurodeles waltl TaxID=8319 RepID=A0AAV7NYF3_PLEWA|nr:hypothetical protein NDU88_006555 [Pleurodeles waltl]